MAQIALCPRCIGIIAITATDEPSRQLRCPRCAAIFPFSEVAESCTTEPPLAMPVEPEPVAAVEIESVEPAGEHVVVGSVAIDAGSLGAPPNESQAESQPVAPVTATAEPQSMAMQANRAFEAASQSSTAAAVESPGEAWFESLSSAEGATFAGGDFDDPEMARPYHAEPHYDPQLAVDTNNGSAWPELAAALAAERSLGGEPETIEPSIEAPAEQAPAAIAVEQPIA
ncbi:MAG TPA: hypothetical protein VG713_01595, partial [Pirellulales bacterium]|nr:hypothetical protein [Pirellulales bacterium]